MKSLNMLQVSKLAGDSIVRILHKIETASTNDDAVELARAGAEVGTVVVAERQTQGRGRRHSHWHAQPGETLCFSLITELAGQEFPPSLVAGVACANALQSLGVNAQIKWPNDIMLGGKKLGGILTEAENGRVVVGIGLNVSVENFPEELEGIATSLRREVGSDFDPSEVLGVLLEQLGRALVDHSLSKNQVLEGVRSRCFLTSKPVTLQSAGRELSGHVRGIGDDGELLLWTGNSLLSLIQAEEIRVQI